MTRLFYPLKRLLTNFARRPLPAFAALLSLTMLLIMIDLIWITRLSGERYFDNTTAAIEMELFLADSLSESGIMKIKDSLENNEGITGVTYISKETARQRLLALMGTDLLAGLDDNPLPRSILINFDNEFVTAAFIEQLTGVIKNMNDISEIYSPVDILAKVENSRWLADKITLILGVVIILTVLLNLLYSIRLSVKTHEPEIYQYRLLGAGRMFLSMPFILEGIFYTAVASVAGWLILYYGSTMISFEEFTLVLPNLREIIYFCLITAAIGLIVGFVGIRRSL